jgi:hypothetical protein
MDLNRPHPLPRPIAAWAFSELGDLARARRALTLAITDAPTLHDDEFRLVALGYAAQAAATVGDRGAAVTLIALLLPHREFCGNKGAVVMRRTSRLLDRWTRPPEASSQRRRARPSARIDAVSTTRCQNPTRPQGARSQLVLTETVPLQSGVLAGISGRLWFAERPVDVNEPIAVRGKLAATGRPCGAALCCGPDRRRAASRRQPGRQIVASAASRPANHAPPSAARRLLR